MKNKNKFLNNYVLNEGYKNNSGLFDKANGSKITIGNKDYLDLSFAAGSLLLGHQSRVFTQSLKEIIKKKLSIMAAPNKQAQDYSKILKNLFPHFERFIFCSTGSEAVMKSIRISKAITKKNLIMSVTGSWHGSNDRTLFTVDKNFKSIPISSGLSKYDQSQIKFLPYDDIVYSKKILDKSKKKISCILIEPIQASLPNSKVKKYLYFLKNYAQKNKIILIFDEMITGLRTNCGSVQTLFKIKPDISTFGKCFGGGMPIGIIGVSKRINKLINKQQPKVFFGGTFSGNSISTYVGKKTVEYIVKNKNKIFKNLNLKSKFFNDNLITIIAKNHLKISIYKFHSMFRLVFTDKIVKNRIQRDFFESKKNKKINLFKKFLFDNKIYYPSNGIIFISYQTNYEDIKKILKYFEIGLVKYFRNEK